MSKYGVFSEPAYLGPGVTYVKQEKKKINNDTPLNFKATLTRSGKGNDATFDQFKLLYKGEKYTDPSNLNNQKIDKKASKPWKTVSPMKKSCYLGDFYGTLQGKIPYIPVRCNLEDGKKKGEIKNERRNFYTCPGKKGSYGYNKTSLSEKKGSDGVVGEYKYEISKYVSKFDREKLEAQEERKKRLTEVPFIPSQPGKKGTYGYSGAIVKLLRVMLISNLGLTLNKNGNGIVGEYKYIPEGGEREKEKSENVKIPFKPTNSGLNATLNKFPSYLPDPILDLTRKNDEESVSKTPWKPNMFAKSDFSKSIVKMNI